MGSTLDELVEVVNNTAPRGNIIIPAFAVGRTQELLYHFMQLAQQGRLNNVEIFVDSPMAVAATEITLKHFSVFDEEAKQLLGSAAKLMESRRVHFISDVEDSIRLNRIKSGAVIISASGMCDAGRILHHLRNNLGNPDCTVIICGFQTEGSLGRRLVDGVKQGPQICLRNISGVINADGPGGYKSPSKDVKPFDCELPRLPAIDLKRA